MNFMTQLGVLAIILIILVIIIKSNQTLEQIYMEEETEQKAGIDIEMPKLNLSEIKLPKWKKTKNKKREDKKEELSGVFQDYEDSKISKKQVQRSSGTMPVDTSAKWSVEVLDDRGRVTASHRISSFPFDIGRNEDNDLVLDDLSVSGYHARVEDAYGSIELVDQGSLNKIIVDGRSVTQIEVLDRMEVDFGNTRLRFCKEGKKSNPTIAYKGNSMMGNSLMEEWH